MMAQLERDLAVPSAAGRDVVASQTVGHLNILRPCGLGAAGIGQRAALGTEGGWILRRNVPASAGQGMIKGGLF